MARKKFTLDERREKARDIAIFIINEDREGRKVSTRSLAQKFNLSNYTISTLMGTFLEKNFPGLYVDVHRILQGNIPKTIEQIDVKRRVLEAAKLSLQGMTVEQISEILGESINVIYEDLQTRLKSVDEEAYKQVLLLHNQHSAKNLTPGNPRSKEQSRDSKGRFHS